MMRSFGFSLVPLIVAFAWGSAVAKNPLQAQIDAAAAGATLRVPAGVFVGTLEIDKPLTLEGEPGAVLRGSGKGDVCRITGTDVTIRGFTIENTGISLDQENAGITILADRATIENNVLQNVLFGVYLKDAADCVIRGNDISGMDLEIQRRGDAIRIWRSENCRIEDNVVTNGRDVVIWFSSDAIIARNTVRNGRYGLHFMYSHSNLIEDNYVEGNSVGAFLMYSKNLKLVGNEFSGNRGPSGYGIGLKDMDGVDAQDNRLIGNRIGIYIDNSPGSMDVYDHFTRNIIAFNDMGVAFLPSVKRNIFRDNMFFENVEQVAVLGAGDFGGNDFTVEGRGNFWSDYNGYDLDADGLGDIPYRSESLFEDLMDREKKLRLFLFSPAQQAIELAARALPAIKPRTKLTDTAPLMVPVALRHASPVAALPAWPLTLLAFGLVLGSGLALRSGWGGSADASKPGEPTRVTAADSIMRVSSVTKSYGAFRALDDVSFDVRAGEAIVFWGRNGAGKTTLLRCVLGLSRFQGDIKVAGHSVHGDGKEVRRCVGYVPQELSFHEDMGVIETLTFYAKIKKVRSLRIPEVLREVGLEEHGHKRVGELSGGMKQRLALALALLADPPLLLLDELTSNLDAGARHGFLELLKQQRERGKTIVFTSHRVEEVRALADRALILEGGRLVSVCSPDEFLAQQGLRTCLSLLIDADQRALADVALRGRGFEVSINGDGPERMRVFVPFGKKIEVLQALSEGGFRVLDFEIEDVDDPPAGAPTPSSEGSSWT